MKFIKVCKNKTILNETACKEANLNINVKGLLKEGGRDFL